MTSFWAEAAVVDGVVTPSVRITADAGIVTSVSTEPPRESDRVLPGLTVPGLANGHSHAFHRALRGRTHDGGGTFWTWREQMYALASRLTPDSYYELASAAFAEMLLAGYTVVGEFHYLHDASVYGTAMDEAVLAAADTAGIRMTLLDTLYLQGGLSEGGSALPLAPEQQRFSDGSLAGWATRHASLSVGDTARLGAAVHSVRAVDPSLLADFATLTVGSPVHAHVSEQPAENLQTLAAWGRTPVQVLEPLLGADFTAVHGTHLSDDDIRLLGSSASTVCICPTTERDLADGVGPGSALLAAGASLSLGSDQNAVIDPFEEVRGLEMDERLVSGERGRFSPSQLLTAATADGYRSLGWDGGSIAVGSLCDLTAVSTTSVRTAGAAADQLWLAATAADVTTVVVNGTVVVDGGRHPFGDIGAMLASSIAALTTDFTQD
ncbi:formimidoylglutamate deiminase [Lacisediminihabitans changchengi]|uniref:Formimidoylglutamate deiminase n=1 Tax=Lacisediminihabitans changchengi TaxID=2787634 RepID=A0A934SI54_9MICO|nr:formimidoylglutamate deiminase [Lacisediminihabitans changchengi]MBK4346033.1 formimidoylglutamate deiminase [Lacisediminihabitans changchengi]